MFTSARIRLTIWYLLIIMVISIMFSIAIYRILTSELEREVYRISNRYVATYGQLFPGGQDLQESAYLQASENRIIWTLIYINLVIFGVSGFGGYLLAGITLKPIRVMLSEQNRFITDASHELRTPITALRSEIEVYLRGKNHTVAAADTLLASNLEEVGNLQKLSDSLIKLSNNQTQNHIATTVALSEVLQDAVRKVQKYAKQKQITITTKPLPAAVSGEKDSLVQLFGILLENAIKYSGAKSEITIKSHKKDGSVEVIVKDQGIGIAKKDIPHIFDRFYRADTSRTKQQTPGYGLGLSIAKKIIEAHHGSIRVESEPGKGSTFIVALPRNKKTRSAFFQSETI